MGYANPPFFELLAYNGYKFVVLSILVISKLALGDMVSYFVLLFFGSMFVIFYF
jgi:hypothetical protein